MIGTGNGESSKVTQFKPGRAKTGGRKAGTTNKISASVKERASLYVDDALNALVGIATDPQQPAAARVAAGKEILDRADGRPAQRIETTITDATESKYDDIASQIRAQIERGE